MELAQINNSQNLNSVKLNLLEPQQVKNSDLQPIQNNNNLDRVEYSHSIQSGFNLNISSTINSVSAIQTAVSGVSNALKLVDNFERTVTANSESLNDKQVDIQSFINQFNTFTKNLSDNISKIIEEKESEDSRIYFDGILGAKPIDGKEIFEAITQQKQKLEQYNSALNNKLLEETNQAQEMFSKERSQSPIFEKSTKGVDFEFESVNFEAKTIKQQSGSITQTQAHAEPDASKNLLVAS